MKALFVTCLFVLSFPAMAYKFCSKVSRVELNMETKELQVDFVDGRQQRLGFERQSPYENAMIGVALQLAMESKRSGTNLCIERNNRRTGSLQDPSFSLGE